VPATSAASSKGIFAATTISTNQTYKTGDENINKSIFSEMAMGYNKTIGLAPKFQLNYLKKSNSLPIVSSTK
jgi:hypothetical protein